MSADLRLECFGGLRVLRGETPITGFVSSKAPALLCYLAATGRTHFRATLASLFWGDTSDAGARMNLRHVLANLRQLVGAHLVVTHSTIAFNRKAPYQFDMEQFQLALNQSEQQSAASIDQLALGVRCYQGDFLDGFLVRGAPGFDEWAASERERLRQMVLHALHRLIVYYASQGKYAEGIDAATRLLAIDPWREAAHRHLMQLLAYSGQRGAAMAQYRACASILARDLGITPAPETAWLFEQIRSGLLDPPRQNHQATRPAPIVERRQLTILACCWAGLAELAEQHEPHEVFQLLFAYRQSCYSIVEQFGGRVIYCHGEAMQAVFGYQRSVADAALRAVLAGLWLVAKLREIHLPAPGANLTPLGARVGVHTGSVVVSGGVDGAPEVELIGAAAHTASELQLRAEPHAVLISGATEQLVRAHLVCAALDAGQPGVSNGLKIYQAIGERGAQGVSDGTEQQTVPFADAGE